MLENDHPQSVRHVYYRLTDPRLPVSVPKTENGYRQVGRELVKLRSSSLIPYNWISDSTRFGYTHGGWDGAADFVLSVAGQYRGETWSHLSEFPEVRCESRSLAGVLQPLCREYGVSLYPAGGFSSLTFIYEAAMALNRTAAGRKVLVLYAGDYDPAGVLIDRDIEKKLREHLNSTVELEFRRIGITEEQVAKYDLPTKPRKAGDHRASNITETVEAEAMPAELMRGLFRREFNRLIPPGYLDAVRAAEKSERVFLIKLGTAMNNSGDLEAISEITNQYTMK